MSSTSLTVMELQQYVMELLVNYVETLISQPEFLFSEFQQLDNEKFQMLMTYLLGGRTYVLTNLISINFGNIRDRIFYNPGGNRSLFVLTWKKCLPALNSTECMNLVDQLLRLTSGAYLTLDMIKGLPETLQEATFKNISAAFKDIYDKLATNTQSAIYEWMTRILKKDSPNSKLENDLSGAVSWVTAESLWFLGRYIVHLPLQEIQEISLTETRLFISYDNATKQLDSVYDITPDIAKAFLRRINSSGFDIGNASTVYRLGLLVCFHDNLQQLDTMAALNLLHQLIKCNQLKGFQADIQKHKSQLLDIILKNYTLNDTLGSLSDAVVGLTSSQLESLSPKAVQSAISALQQVSGWTRSQAIIIADKFLSNNKILTLSNISQMGALASGISTDLLYNVNADELLQAIKGTLTRHTVDLTPAQQQAIISKILSTKDISSAINDVPGVFFKTVPLSSLTRINNINISAIGDKQLTSSQALFLFDSLSKNIPTVNLTRMGQLVKGITCEQISNMDNLQFVNNFSPFEKNFHILSPYQIRCLAWKFWEASEQSIPPVLLAVLPTVYLENAPASLCESLVVSLGKINLDFLILNSKKRAAVIKKVLQCMDDMVKDDFDVDKLGRLICHLPPKTIQNQILSKAMVAALKQFKTCTGLSKEQKLEVKKKLKEVYGEPQNWTSELLQDMGPFLTLLSKEELTIAKKFPDAIQQIVPQLQEADLPEELLSVLFDVVQNTSASIKASRGSTDCVGVRVPSSDDIRKLKEGNSLWSVQQLKCMSTETFTKSVERLGAVTKFNISQLTALKEKALQVWGELSVWRSYHIVALGQIAISLKENEIQKLDLSSIDTVAALSQQTQWTSSQVKSILQGFLEDSGLSVSDLKSYDLAGLGPILCGMNFTEISTISATEFSATVSRIGHLSCTIEVLQEFKKKVETIFGSVSNWNSSVLQEIGTIAAALHEKELQAVNINLMPYFQPRAIAVMPIEILKTLSPKQIANLGPENAEAVTPSQKAALDAKQLQSLGLAIEGSKPKGPDNSVTSNIPTTTSTVSNGIAFHSGHYFWLCVSCILHAISAATLA
nr:PREDICTED: otoancorin [Latimeria chalumnae]|eukprot:XP_005998448.1 PREDICTED: otoancorin [Latimeria chalumnae]